MISSFELFKACLFVRERFPSVAVWGIPWLHFTNTDHPVHHQMISKRYLTAPFLILARIPWLFFRSLCCLCLVVFLNHKFKTEKSRLKQERFDLLIKTWDITGFAEQNRDFYFGDFQKRFTGYGSSSLMVVGNVIHKQWFSFIRKYKKREWTLPDYCLLAFRNIFQVVCMQISAAGQLFFRSCFEKEELLQRLFRKASIDSLSAQTMRNALHYWIGKNTVIHWNPKAFLTLYEGHAWEKCLWRGIRRGSKRCRIVAYQHTVLMRHAFDVHAPKREILNGSAPDIILCSGNQTLKMMLKKGGSQTLIPFGTFRSLPNGHLEKGPYPGRRTILVIPEGIFSEACLLFNVAMEMATKLKNHHFIFRCHPILPFQQVKHHLRFRWNQIPNIELSKKTNIDEDFDRSSIVFYRGSSAVMYAILKGLKPFYIAFNNTQDRDPLFELPVWRARSPDLHTLLAGIEKFENAQLEVLQAEWKEAVGYVQNYMTPVADTSFPALIASIKTSPGEETRI